MSKYAMEYSESLSDYFDPKPKTLYSIEMVSVEFEYNDLCYFYQTDEEIFVIQAMPEYSTSPKYIIARFQIDDPTLVPVLGFGLEDMAMRIRETSIEAWLTHENFNLREFAKKYVYDQED